MSPAPDESTPREGEICIDPSQLRPGVHVRLPVSWVEHQFIFNSFVIADEKQARLIAAMKLPQLFCEPARCRVPPLPNSPAAATAETERDGQEQQLAAVIQEAHTDGRRARADAIQALKLGLLKAEVLYRRASQTVSVAIQRFSVNPQQSVEDLAMVCQGSLEALLGDPDSAFVLIAKKVRGDEQAAHPLSVMTLVLLLGKQAGLPHQALCVLGTGALLHDIGMRSINPSILRNSERNRHEEAIFRSHCRNGFDEASRVDSLSKPILETILHHHERQDGSGFPDRLAGNAIPVWARMVAIVDRFDNLVNPVDLRQAVSPSEALSILWAKEQQRFDRTFLQLFIRAMGIYPPGSIVRLSDGRIGAVVASAPVDKPLSPKVLVYAPEVSHHQAIIADLATQDVVSIERMLPLQDRPVAELDYLLPHRKIAWSCPGN